MRSLGRVVVNNGLRADAYRHDVSADLLDAGVAFLEQHRFLAKRDDTSWYVSKLLDPEDVANAVQVAISEGRTE